MYEDEELEDQIKPKKGEPDAWNRLRMSKHDLEFFMHEEEWY